MSRTNAHAPYWVQCMRAAQEHRWYAEACHKHTKYDCNIDDDWFTHPSAERRHTGYRIKGEGRTPWENCRYHVVWPYAQQFFGRPSAAGYLRKEYWGRERTRVRNQIAAQDWDDIAPSRTRHSVLWDCD